MELPKPVQASPFFPPCMPNWKPLTRPSPSSFPELSPLRCCTSSLPSSGEFGVQGGRRSVSILTAFLLAPFPHRATAGGSILDKYVKKPKESLEINRDALHVSHDMWKYCCSSKIEFVKKRLDPLDAYVPAVILSQLLIEDLGKTLEGDNPEFGICRSLLRSGPAASLRVNIRVVAQYASESRDGNMEFNDVDRCLRALKELDSLLLLHESRKEPDMSVSSMKGKVDVAVKALDRLLRTGPDDILDKGKNIADAYRSPAEEEPKMLDPEFGRPESIL